MSDRAPELEGLNPEQTPTPTSGVVPSVRPAAEVEAVSQSTGGLLDNVLDQMGKDGQLAAKPSGTLDDGAKLKLVAKAGQRLRLVDRKVIHLELGSGAINESPEIDFPNDVA